MQRLKKIKKNCQVSKIRQIEGGKFSRIFFRLTSVSDISDIPASEVLRIVFLIATNCSWLILRLIVPVPGIPLSALLTEAGKLQDEPSSLPGIITL